MGNSKKCDDDFIKKVYDLKGSMSKRKVFKEKEKKNTAVLKDKNLLHLKKQEKCILFQTEDITQIMNQIGKDISLLNHFNLMDYSLLFVIEYNPEYVKENPFEFLHKKEKILDNQKEEEVIVKPIQPSER